MTKEERREYHREWRKKHPDYYKEYFKEYNTKTKEEKSLFQRIFIKIKKIFIKTYKNIKGGQDDSNNQRHRNLHKW